MAKKKETGRKKDASQIEHLRGELRSARKNISVLRKELEKSLHYRPKVLDSVIGTEYKEEDTSCPLCKSKLKLLDLPNKQVVVCSECSYRSILKKEK